jgi:hypothetical protein
MDTVGVVAHKDGYSTKYVILQIGNAVQNFGVLRYFSSLQHFLLMADLKMQRIPLILTHM